MSFHILISFKRSVSLDIHVISQVGSRKVFYNGENFGSAFKLSYGLSVQVYWEKYKNNLKSHFKELNYVMEVKLN